MSLLCVCSLLGTVSPSVQQRMPAPAVIPLTDTINWLPLLSLLEQEKVQASGLNWNAVSCH